MTPTNPMNDDARLTTKLKISVSRRAPAQILKVEEPAADEGADDAEHEVAEKAQSASFHDGPREPSCNTAND